MGMVPILWTRTPDGGQFDTNGLSTVPSCCLLHAYQSVLDWKVAGNLTTGKESVGVFQNILTNASAIDTGFVVVAVTLRDAHL